ncbi:VaFE repeat-containing surface-anchored protein [Streptococcus merionis]|uniref:LPXTG cell wall surface protein n=1 Tax=Streptococcus merionis TaxID=400065 RepID=A0A239SV20_9STRE|nr:VaFE repeat-containing surface-anchored protein [Streptococcus merionis]SNU89341.1 LPXTG cell wall surface protein [Streptococcus merionis]
MTKRNLMRAIVTLMMIISSLLPLGAAQVSAATEISPQIVVDELSVTTTDGKPYGDSQTNAIRWWSTFLLRMNWDATAAQNNIKEGDYFIVQLPDEFHFPKSGSANEFDVYDDKGNVAGKGVITPKDDNSGGTVKVTFTKAVEGLYNVKGTLQLSAELNRQRVQSGSEIPISVQIGGKVVPIENGKIHIGTGPKKIENETLHKWGSDSDKETLGSGKIWWYVRLNHKKGKFYQAIVGDELKDVEGKNPSLQYIPGTFEIYEVNYNEIGGNTGRVGDIINFSQHVQFGPDNKSFTVDLTKIPQVAEGLKQGKSYEVRYQSTYVPGTKIANSITLKTEQGNFKVEQSFRSADSGGTAQGEKGKVKVIKIDAADPTVKLPKAQFELWEADDETGKEFVEKKEVITTNENGEGLSQMTLNPRKKYILKEINPPLGYTVDKNSTNVPVQPDPDAVVAPNILNKKEETSVSGEKTWVNDDPAKRPAQIEVQLLADGVEVPDQKKTVTPGADGKWKYEFTGLTKYKFDPVAKQIVLDENGQPVLVNYSVKEVDVPENYTSVPNGMNVINTYTPKEVPLKFKKTDIAGAELAGAHLKVVKTEDNSVVQEWDSDGSTKEITIQPGKYKLIETAAPEGYVLATTIEFEVTDDGKVIGGNVTLEGSDQIITMVDDYKYHDVTVSKVDLGGKELPGAKVSVKSIDGTPLIKDEDGTTKAEVAWESTDTPKVLKLRQGKYLFHEESAPDGYVTVTDIEFTVDKDGKVTVDRVAEDDVVKSEGGKITITDRKKPSVKTEAKVNNKKEDEPTGKVVLTDVVKYKNLIKGKEYTAKLVWMNKATNQPFMVNGKELTAEKKFTAAEADGQIELSVTVDAKDFQGETRLVAFEEVYRNGIEVAAHKEIDDEDQTVVVKTPKSDLGTVANVNGKKEAVAEGTIKLTDKVSYKKLIVGKEYKLQLTWMDKATGQPVMVDGKALTTEKVFTPTAANGEEELSIDVEANHFTADTHLVAYEKLFQNDVQVAAHEDINDADQAVFIKERFKPITFSKTNLGGEEIEGAKITVKSADNSKLIEDDKGKRVASIDWVSGKTPKVLNLLAGKYIFHEESAPEGFLTVTDVEFTVDSDGKVTVTKVAEDDIVKAEGSQVTIADRKKPTVKTEAKVNGQKEAVPTGKVNLTDVVKYKDLIVGKKYVAKLTWMDKKTNKPFLINGKEVTAEKEFIAGQADGEIELSVTVDAKDFQGETKLVAFEKLYQDKVEVAAHEDINDVDQTVVVKTPKADLKTTALANGEKQTIAQDKIVLTDKVAYSKLVVGKEYKLQLTWMDKDTKAPFLANGQPVTAEKTFTATSSDGEVELSVEVDAANFTKQTTLVAFEKLFNNNKEIAAHEDINDVDQTVVVGEDFKPVTVSKTDLGGTELPGATITVRTADSSNLIENKDGGEKLSTITWESSNTPKVLNLLPGNYIFHEESAPDGYVTVTDIEFTVDKDGNVTVTKVAEDDEVKSNGGKITITDRKKPTVKTEAKVNGQKLAEPTGKVTLTDVVKYKNLIKGKEYTAKLVWMDKATGQPFLVEGQPVTAETTFVAEEADGQVELSVEVDAKYFQGETKLVAFEELQRNGIEVAAHKDIEDEDQTVTVREPKPEVKTLAKVNDAKQAIATGTITLKDTVSYKNLVIGKTYTLQLTWMDKATGQPFLVEGQPVTVEKTFVAEKADGEEELSVDVEARHFTKKTTLVAFEKLLLDGAQVGGHEDINDVDQAVVIVEDFKSIIVSKTDLGGKELPGAKITVRTADGSNLIENKDGGEKLSTITWTSGDTPKVLSLLPGNYIFHEEAAPDGYLAVTDIEFTVGQDGNITVTKVAEDDIVKAEGSKIAVTDRRKPTPPTPEKPTVKTEAKVNGQKSAEATGKLTLTDRIVYKNLIAGKKYVAKLTWMDKATGKPFLIDGKPITVEKEFVAEKANGQVELSVTVDAKHFQSDTKLVAFEKLFHEGKQVAAHEDINDTDQTVTIRKPKPKEPKGPKLPKTNAESGTVLTLTGLSLITLLAIVVYKRKRS